LLTSFLSFKSWYFRLKINEGSNNTCIQVECYNARLQLSEIVGIKSIVAGQLPEGVNEHGLTLKGFLFLHVLFIKRGHPEEVWTVLRTFGYNDDIKLAKDLIPSFTRAPDQVTYHWGQITIIIIAMALLEIINYLLCAEIFYLFYGSEGKVVKLLII
jgi:hypothetical protein